MKKNLILFFTILLWWYLPASGQTSTYNYIGSVQIYTVTGGATSLNIDLAGAQGGNYTTPPPASGGLGGRVQCTLAVTPGELLYVYVGQMGNAGCNPCGLTVPPPGGTNSGGGADGGAGSTADGGAAGGGSSDIRTIPYASGVGPSLSSRLVVGGGGGGGAWDCGHENGGAGGGLTGGTGLSCTAYSPTEAGSPGTQSSGGSFGSGTGPAGSGTAGGFGYGGNAFPIWWGGGGGGGWFGAGGAWSGSACGGSSYYGAAGVTSPSTTPGYQSGNGYVIISVNCAGGIINGTRYICAGATTSFSDTVGGGSGTWSSNNTSVASVNLTTGFINGISSGTAIITYSVNSYCGSVYSVATITVNPLPASITGITSVCAGLVTTLVDGTTGGTWSSGNTAIATVLLSTGTVSGVSQGTAAITYTLPTGCKIADTVTISSLEP